VTFDRRDGAYGDLGPFQATSRQPAPDGVPERWFVQAAVGDDVDDHARQVVAALRSLGSLRGDLEPKAAADVLWLLIDPGQYRRLVTERHWSHRAFRQWQADAMTRLLLA